MDARRLLRRLRAAGFSLRAKEGGGVGVSPASNLTEWTEGLIRERKDAVRDLLRPDIELEEEPPCADCGARLPLGGVRCPACRDRLDDPACASCGAEVPAPGMSSVCSLCSLEAARLARGEPAPPPEKDQG